MTIAEQLKRVREALSEWARGHGGVAEVATDAVSLVLLLSNKPGTPRAVVLFGGEEKRGDYEELGRVDRRFLVVISRGRGLLLDAGDRLTDAVGAPMFDLVEEAREIVRGLRFDAESTEERPDFRGIRRVDMEGLVVDAYQIEFGIGVQLPMQEQGEVQS